MLLSPKIFVSVGYTPNSIQKVSWKYQKTKNLDTIQIFDQMDSAINFVPIWISFFYLIIVKGFTI